MVDYPSLLNLFCSAFALGNPLAPRDAAAIIERFSEHLKNCELAVIGGSYPPSARGDNWENHAATLCELAARAAVKVLYDGKGKAFARALQNDNLPWAIKPNLAEASELLNRDLESPKSQQNAVVELMARGIEVVLLSCGARGLWLGHNSSHVEWIPAPAIEEVSPVGSGDALVGAFVATWLQSGDVFQAARWGAAAGSANAARLEAARIGPRDAERLIRNDFRQD